MAVGEGIVDTDLGDPFAINGLAFDREQMASGSIDLKHGCPVFANQLYLGISDPEARGFDPRGEVQSTGEELATERSAVVDCIPEDRDQGVMFGQ